MSKLTPIHTHPKSSAKHWRPLQTLKDTVKQIESGEIKAERVFIAILSDSDGFYQTTFRYSNLDCPEAVALLEICKNKICREMIPEDN